MTAQMVGINSFSEEQPGPRPPDGAHPFPFTHLNLHVRQRDFSWDKRNEDNFSSPRGALQSCASARTPWQLTENQFDEFVTTEVTGEVAMRYLVCRHLHLLGFVLRVKDSCFPLDPLQEK